MQIAMIFHLHPNIRIWNCAIQSPLENTFRTICVSVIWNWSNKCQSSRLMQANLIFTWTKTSFFFFIAFVQTINLKTNSLIVEHAKRISWIIFHVPRCEEEWKCMLLLIHSSISLSISLIQRFENSKSRAIGALSSLRTLLCRVPFKHENPYHIHRTVEKMKINIYTNKLYSE